MRTGNEPSTARSPLGLRLVFAGFGLLAGLAGFVALLVAGEVGWALAFGALAVVAALDAAVIVVRMRQGPHFQPGRDVPPYEPVARPAPRPPRRPLDRPTRMRLYFALMGTCLLLFVLDGVWIRLVSTTAAVVVGAVAACLPPVAVIVANSGRRPPPESARRPPAAE
jgi:MFS family permease